MGNVIIGQEEDPRKASRAQQYSRVSEHSFLGVYILVRCDGALRNWDGLSEKEV